MGFICQKVIQKGEIRNIRFFFSLIELICAIMIISNFIGGGM
ncbi:MAG: prepilin-type N-terminal cleavage/methylation domain-containing protein [Lachnospiraceae bacterium]|nr:prepilin-type N-terminal cleavage/methylation domain-containing protein [Lachnospiraceae bacterium]